MTTYNLFYYSFLNVTLVSMTFADHKTHPTMMTKVVDSLRTVYGLKQLLKQQLGESNCGSRFYVQYGTYTVY